ncbi:unnamed protein product [Effrenium voratum]|nr:unnamed protein product [Effrenium voratum]
MVASPDTSSVKRLGRLIEDQRRALALCGFHSFAAFEAALDAASGDHVAEARKRLQGAEAAWRELLAANEASFGSISRLAVGDPAPKLELLASTGQRISLQEILAKSPSGVLMDGTMSPPSRRMLMNCKHSTIYKWLSWQAPHSLGTKTMTIRLKVGCDFLHLINPSTPGLAGDAGSAYESWGFGKSALGVWAPEALRFYVDQRLADGSDGVPRPQALGQDLQRMGGNIFLDNQVVGALGIVDPEMESACTVQELTLKRFVRRPVLREADIFDPKCLGAWALHRNTLNDDLEAMWLFSSLSGGVGTEGLYNYAAANTYLDELAVLRRSQGLAAVSIQFPEVEEAGMAAASGVRGGAATVSLAVVKQALLQLLDGHGDCSPVVALLPTGYFFARSVFHWLALEPLQARIDKELWSRMEILEKENKEEVRKLRTEVERKKKSST